MTPVSSSASPAPPVAVGVGLEEVDAAEAVHLQVDEAGHGDPAAVRPASPIAAIRPSTISTSPRTSTPSTSAASTPSLIGSSGLSNCSRAGFVSRGRAVSRRPGIDPGEERDDRDLGVAAGAASAASTWPGRAGGEHHDPPRRAPAACRSWPRRRPSGCRRSCRAGSSRPSRACSGRASAPCRPSAASSRR